MTKIEFLEKLEIALKKNNISDTEDILGEYKEHFAFKLADGFTEEQIAEKLGDPAELASQFENEKPGEKHGGRRFVTALGLIFTGIFTVPCFILLWAWELIMAAAAISFGALSVCLLCGINAYSLIPSMPYLCAAVYGLSFFALAVLTSVGCVYVAAFLRQLMRSYVRFNHNVMAAVSGRPVLPPVPSYPQLRARTRRALRRLALGSLAAFAVCFVLSMIISAISANALQFWHAWGWFGYKG